MQKPTISFKKIK